MRLVNDRQRDEEQGLAVPLGLFILCTLLVAFGVAGVFFAPAPFLLAQLRLPDPWSKLAALGGTALALIGFGAPLPWVLYAFVVGLVFAQGVQENRPLLRLFGQTLGVAVLGGIAVVLLTNLQNGVPVSPLVAWNGSVDWAVQRLQEAVPGELGERGKLLLGAADWKMLRERLLLQGPLLYVAFSLLLLWLSLGFAAHYRWTEGLSRLSGEGLRTAQLPVWAPMVFVALFAATYFVPPGPGLELLVGMVRIFAVVLFAAGSLVLSRYLHRRQLAPLYRSLVYGVAILFGFYALVGLACASPLVRRLFGDRSGAFATK